MSRTGNYIVEPYSPSFQERYDEFVRIMQSRKIKPWWFYLDINEIEIRNHELKAKWEESNIRLDKQLGKDRLF